MHKSLACPLGEMVMRPKMSKKHFMPEKSFQRMLTNYADLGSRYCGPPEKAWVQPGFRRVSSC